MALFLACKRHSGGRPDIVGSKRFITQVTGGLALLQARAPDAFSNVVKYVGRIKESDRTGMRAYETPPTFDLADTTAFYSTTWCAAAMAHDSFHSKLYHDYQATNSAPVPDNIWMGRPAEAQCMSYQIDVMRKIGAPDFEIDYAKTQADGHYVNDSESWEEYKKRTW